MKQFTREELYYLRMINVDEALVIMNERVTKPVEYIERGDDDRGVRARAWYEINIEILNSIAMGNEQDNWVIDWKNDAQPKHYMYWDWKTDKLGRLNDCTFQSRSNDLYFSADTYDKVTKLHAMGEFKFWLTEGKG